MRISDWSSDVCSSDLPFDGLTRRELEVAMLLLQGLRQEDVAKRLSLSAKTINTHKSRLFQKLGLADRMSLARLSRQYGLVDPGRVGCRAGAQLAADSPPAPTPPPPAAPSCRAVVRADRPLPLTRRPAPLH